jgi:N-acetylglutamate synthase-like GNAT family acetyltransferase
VELRAEEDTIRDEWKLDLTGPESGWSRGPAEFETRRAGAEDLRELRRLLEESEVSNSEEMREVLASLERRVAEFILVVKEGVVAGCVGLEMFQQEGHLYGEAYVHPRMAELLRPVLWERVMRVATNHSLARIWTQLRDRFYEERGLGWACDGRKRELPRRFGRREEAW